MTVVCQSVGQQKKRLQADRGKHQRDRDNRGGGDDTRNERTYILFIGHAGSLYESCPACIPSHPGIQTPSPHGPRGGGVPSDIKSIVYWYPAVLEGWGKCGRGALSYTHFGVKKVLLELLKNQAVYIHKGVWFLTCLKDNLTVYGQLMVGCECQNGWFLSPAWCL